MPVFRLTDKIIFPDVNLAEDGLLAIDGDLSTGRLLLAYRSGIFPWYGEGEPICWWSPDPRFVLFPEKLKISKSMMQLLKREAFRITYNQAFEQVIEACAQSLRPGQDGTWITREMIDAYIRLHREGYAHSVEVWEGEKLVGGLYGVLLNKIFCGESMFFRVPNASKYGFIRFVQKLKEKGVQLIDCQIYTDHLASLGAEEISRKEFLLLLKKCLK